MHPPHGRSKNRGSGGSAGDGDGLARPTKCLAGFFHIFTDDSELVLLPQLTRSGRLTRSRRLTRPRRLVLLCDVSGSTEPSPAPNSSSSSAGW